MPERSASRGARSTPARFGHRERKKQRTREAIVAAATDLVAERGYQATTVADIAEAANVAPATIFVYFPTKADILFAWWDELADRFRQRFEQAESGESFLDVLRSWCEDETERMSETEIGRAVRLNRRIIDSDDSLLAEERSRLQASESSLTAVLVQQFPWADEVHAAYVASATIASLMTMSRRVLSETMDDEGSVRPYEYIDSLLIFLQGGIEALHADISRGDAKGSRVP